MTRINVIPVTELTRQHLIAEWRELPRIYALVHKAHTSGKPWTNRQPKEYTLGTGHVLFFYDKLAWITERHKQLVSEMINRGYKPSFTDPVENEWIAKIPSYYWKQWQPTQDAITINMQRINERLKNSAK